MILRDYQGRFISNAFKAFEDYDNILGIAATGAGKTVMLSAIAKEFRRVLVLQHRRELMTQNSKTFSWVCPEADLGLIHPKRKDFSSAYSFGMTQTVANCIDLMTPVDLLVIDESHHAITSQPMAIIAKAKKLNPRLKILGVTATPDRSDGAGLGQLFETVFDKVTLDELIASGHLVPPKGYIIDLVDNRLLMAKKHDDEAVAELFNVKAANKRVVQEWKEKAGDRRTIVFCSNIKHAEDVAKEFNRQGVTASVVHSGLKDRERKRRTDALDNGEIQVLVNVGILTEGYDSQPVSCVVLLRGLSGKGTLIQMVGRGLRIVDPQRYPNIIKKDCIVLDFGLSLATHCDLAVDGALTVEPYKEQKVEDEEDPVVQCDCCGGACDPRDDTCPHCGFILSVDSDRSRSVVNFQLTEFELFEKHSLFYWETFGSSTGAISHAGACWSVISHKGGAWYVIGAKKGCHAKILGVSDDKIRAIMTGETFLSRYGDPKKSGKNSGWIHQAATHKQLIWVPDKYRELCSTKHQAQCLMIFEPKKWARIQSLIDDHYSAYLTGHELVN